MNDRSSSDQQVAPDPLLSSADPSLDALREEVVSAARELVPDGDGVEGALGAAGSRGGLTLERPPPPDFGDYSTNAALLLAPRLGAAPREVAERLGAELRAALGERLERF